MDARDAIRRRLLGILGHLTEGLIEREEAARLVLLAAVAGEHILLLGPPGTAKSELARRLHAVVAPGHWFERLLTRFSVPEELFGPLSIKALEDDRYERITAAYLPSASVAFLDEIFKANSAILNALLTLLNERVFDNGAGRQPVPLVCLVAASNEVSEGDELRALHDRFLLRCHVPAVSDDAFEQMLRAPARAGDAPAALTLEELAEIRAQARGVVVPAGVTAHLRAMRAWLREQRVFVSDRRWRRVVTLLQVAAWTDGRDAVALWDCALAASCVWDRPEQREAVRAWHHDRLSQALRQEPERYTRLVEALERLLAQEREARTASLSLAGRPLYRDPEGNVVPLPVTSTLLSTAEGYPLYLPPNGTPGPHPPDGYTVEELYERFFADHFPELEYYIHNDHRRVRRDTINEPVTEAVRYPKAHIESRLAEIAEITRDLTGFVRALHEHLHSFDEAAAPLWLADGPAMASNGRGEGALNATTALADRLRTLREGFHALPRAP